MIAGFSFWGSWCRLMLYRLENNERPAGGEGNRRLALEKAAFWI